MSKLLTVGRHKVTGQPVFIEHARNGLRCDAVCPACGRNLEARQGQSNDWSFAHDNSDPTGPLCIAPYETALHFAAKWIISRGSRIKLPGGKYFEYNHATVEKCINSYRVDVCLLNTVTNKSLLVEVVVFHRLEQDKIVGLQEQGHELLEIDLSGYEGSMAEDALTSLLIDSTHGKTLHKRRLSTPNSSGEIFNPVQFIVVGMGVLIGCFCWVMSQKKRRLRRRR